jgi:hypothetical protein
MNVLLPKSLFVFQGIQQIFCSFVWLIVVFVDIVFRMLDTMKGFTIVQGEVKVDE